MADGFRWRLEDGNEAQGALFDDSVERHVGRGEFRGMEFLHVRAKRVINEVPKASRMPFRHTINAYRGCSHACTYCLEATTPVLLANGRTKAIADLRVGDMVYGTERRDAYRRFVPTPVLDHWPTSKLAYRVTLADGTELVASGDHRFLTDRGWTYVAGIDEGDVFASFPTRFRGKKRPQEHVFLAPKAAEEGRWATSVKALGVEVPMFDITTGTGDFVANGVISHNCFARPTHEYLGMDAGRDFERRIVVKVNAVERVRSELASPRWGGHHIAMGTNTDPYQRCEGKYHLTRGIVSELGAAANPFSILTKSTLVLRDLDVLTDAAAATDVRVNFSIGTLDDDVWQATEPGTPHPRRRVEAVGRLNDAGIPCGVLVAPVLPGLSDRPEQVEEVVRACIDAGAVSVSPILLHLRPGVREQYIGWLEEARPDLLPLHEQLYPRSYAPKERQRQLSAAVQRTAQRAGGTAVSPSRTRQDATAEARPRQPPRTPTPHRQLGLGL